MFSEQSDRAFRVDKNVEKPDYSQGCNVSMNAGCWKEAEEKLFSGNELKEQVKSDGSNSVYISSVPGSSCLCELGVSAVQEQFVSAIDDIVFSLQPFEFGHYRELGFLRDSEANIIPPLSIKAFPEISLHYAGSGHHGSVFKLTGPGEKSFALKIFYERESESNFSGPWNETALGAYVTARGVKDMPLLCLAHPEKSWILTDFIDDKFVSSYPDGPSFSSLNLVTLDPLNDNENWLAGKDRKYRVDYGHLTDKERNEDIPYELINCLKEIFELNGSVSPEEFLDVFDRNPQWRGFLCSKLFCVAPEKRMNVLEKLLQHSDASFFPLSDYIAGGVFSSEDTTALFNLLTQHPEPRVRSKAIFDIRELSKAAACYLGDSWISQPEFIPFMIYLGQKQFEQEILDNSAPFSLARVASDSSPPDRPVYKSGQS